MDQYTENLVNAKYHLKIAERLIKGYEDFNEKRFLTGTINELSKSSLNLIKSLLLIEKKGGKDHDKNISIFQKKVAPKYFNKETTENILKTIELEIAQKNSKIEYAKGDKMILLVGGKYKIITSKRIVEFKDSIKKAIEKLS